MDIKYVVIPEKGIVKAFAVSNTKYAEGVAEPIGDALVAMGANENKLKVRTGICGTAKTHPDDTFDEDKGKQIARDRLLVKYNKALLDANTYCVDAMKQGMGKCNRQIQSSTRKHKNATERLSK